MFSNCRRDDKKPTANIRSADRESTHTTWTQRSVPKKEVTLRRAPIHDTRDTGQRAENKSSEQLSETKQRQANQELPRTHELLQSIHQRVRRASQAIASPDQVKGTIRMDRRARNGFRSTEAATGQPTNSHIPRRNKNVSFGNGCFRTHPRLRTVPEMCTGERRTRENDKEGKNDWYHCLWSTEFQRQGKELHNPREGVSSSNYSIQELPRTLDPLKNHRPLRQVESHHAVQRRSDKEYQSQQFHDPAILARAIKLQLPNGTHHH